ncbi:MAG: ParB/RepB/Spo0J family partition protein [Candidatus Binatia bacterium]
MQKKGLGRGLGALIRDIDAPGNLQIFVETDRIAPNTRQPRRSFEEGKLDELAASVREKGIIQPLLVRRKQEGYELITGERRLRAAIKAGLREVPVIVRDATDSEALQLALIENLQREDLNPLEEAHAYQRLQEEFSWSQEELASKVGRSRPAIANSMRLLSLPQQVQKEVALGKLPVGQARALLGLGHEQLTIAAAREVIAKGLSTRETERLVQLLKAGKRRRSERAPLDPNLTSLVEGLQRWLGTRVRLLHRASSGKGKIEIEYHSNADLDRITRKMMENQRI